MVHPLPDLVVADVDRRLSKFFKDLSRCRLFKSILIGGDGISIVAIWPGPSSNLVQLLRPKLALVHRRIQKIQLTVHYLIGFASTFPIRLDRSVWVDALVGIREPYPGRAETGGQRTQAFCNLRKTSGEQRNLQS
jgi:hypothetical protein